MEARLIFADEPLLSEEALKSLTPQALSFVGDAVFELIVRTRSVDGARRPVEALHREKTKQVNAAAQAALVKKITPLLTEDERDILRRGTNARQHGTPKHQSVGDYHRASGLEALCGYLYLKGEGKRLTELITQGLTEEAELDAGSAQG